MDAMILAAGLGSRLDRLTRDTPKALIEVGRLTLLERTVRRLSAAGADRIIVNVHHYAERIEGLVRRLSGVGAEILLSREVEGPLETGGGLLRAAPLFRRESPFFLHNVDVIADFDLTAMYRTHGGSGSLATLAVSSRSATRYLLFDDEGLFGRVDARTGREERARPPSGTPRSYGFTGVHVVSPLIFDAIREDGTFSIVDAYLSLVRNGYRVLPHDVTGSLWLDVGTPERLRAARATLAAEAADLEEEDSTG